MPFYHPQFFVVVRQWPNKLRNNFRINQNVLGIILFADDQAIIAEIKGDL
jgi:hypothetical protein